MIEINLLIFDLDGTLVDSKDVIVNAVNYSLKKLNLETRPYNEIVSYIGTGTRDLILKTTGLEDKKIIEKGIKLFKNYWSKYFKYESKLFPGVVEILKHFDKKEKILLSNGTIKVIQKILRNFGLKKYFKTIITGDEEDCLKPTACPIDRAMDIFKINQRDKSIIIGDMTYDIISGKKAGIKTCAVTYGIGDLNEIINLKPDFIIDNILELKNIIK